MNLLKLMALILIAGSSSQVSADILIRGGTIINGTPANGAPVNGAPVNGASVNGASVNGDSTDRRVADILIRDDKIVAIRDNLAANDDVTVVDASGKIITTGLFNSHTQLGLTEVGAVAATRDYETSNPRITASLRVSDAINPSSVLLPHNRMLGLSHALVQPDSDGGLFAGTATIIQMSAQDTVQVSAAGMVVKLGSTGQKFAGGSRAAAMALLREAIEDARDYRANKDSFNRGARREYQLSRHDLEALVPVIQGRIPLIVHVDRAVDIERTIEFAKRNKLKLIIAGAEEGWRVAESLAKNNVPVIMDPISNLPTSYDHLGARLDNAKLLDDAGVTLLFTGMSWHNTHNAYLVRQSAGNAVANGLSYQTALAAMTTNPAKVFGLKGLGSIAEGNQANVVIWSADPLEPSTIVEKVFLNGVDQPLVSRATRLRDRYFSRLKQGG